MSCKEKYQEYLKLAEKRQQIVNLALEMYKK